MKHAYQKNQIALVQVEGAMNFVGHEHMDPPRTYSPRNQGPLIKFRIPHCLELCSDFVPTRENWVPSGHHTQTRLRGVCSLDAELLRVFGFATPPRGRLHSRYQHCPADFGPSLQLFSRGLGRTCRCLHSHTVRDLLTGESPRSLW